MKGSTQVEDQASMLVRTLARRLGPRVKLRKEDLRPLIGCLIEVFVGGSGWGQGRVAGVGDEAVSTSLH